MYDVIRAIVAAFELEGWEGALKRMDQARQEGLSVDDFIAVLDRQDMMRWGEQHAEKIVRFEDYRMAVPPAREFFHAEGASVSTETVAFSDTLPAVLTIRDATLPAGQGIVRSGNAAFFAGPATGGWPDKFFHSVDGRLAWSEAAGKLLAYRPEPRRIIPEAIFMNFGSTWFGFRVLNLAALALVREAIGDKRLPVIIRAKETEAPDPVQLEAMRRILGHDDIIVLRLRNPETLVQRLHVPFLPIQVRKNKVYYSSVALDLLRKYLGIAKSPPRDAAKAKRIYVSRRDVSGRRSVVNEDEVVKILGQHGFRVIETTGMALEQRLEILQDAEIVAGAVGSNMINALLAPSGCWVLQFVPREFDVTPHNRDALGNLVSSVGQNYVRLSCSTVAEDKLKLLASGINVPPDTLRATLEFMETKIAAASAPAVSVHA